MFLILSSAVSCRGVALRSGIVSNPLAAGTEGVSGSLVSGVSGGVVCDDFVIGGGDGFAVPSVAFLGSVALAKEYGAGGGVGGVTGCIVGGGAGGGTGGGAVVCDVLATVSFGIGGGITVITISFARVESYSPLFFDGSSFMRMSWLNELVLVNESVSEPLAPSGFTNAATPQGRLAAVAEELACIKELQPTCRFAPTALAVVHENVAEPPDVMVVADAANEATEGSGSMSDAIIKSRYFA